MREIKFRAWNQKDKMFIYDDNIFLSFDGDVFRYGMFETMDMSTGIILQQFTGLKDKNGKEVYEGDILSKPHFSSRHLNHIVEWYDKFTGWWARNTSAQMDDNDGSVQLWVYARMKDFKVIGNICENPELAK